VVGRRERHRHAATEGFAMTYQITLTDEEYSALVAAAEAQGKSVEALVHTALAEQYLAEPKPAERKMTNREFLENLYRKGLILNIPDRRPLSPEEQADREQRAQSVLPGKPASETVVEDRGSR
jgi:hypothetical protein